MPYGIVLKPAVLTGLPRFFLRKNLAMTQVLFFRLPETKNSNAYRRCWWVEDPPYKPITKKQPIWAVLCVWLTYLNLQQDKQSKCKYPKPLRRE